MTILNTAPTVKNLHA